MQIPFPVVVATAAAAIISTGCGSSPATVADPGPATVPVSSSGPAHACGASPAPRARALTLTSSDSDRTYCVAPGSRILVYLKGTPAHRWAPIRVSSGVLRPAASGHLTLALGVTGASFVAAYSGGAVITSVQPLCDSTLPPGTGVQTSVRRCAGAQFFRVTVLVQG